MVDVLLVITLTSKLSNQLLNLIQNMISQRLVNCVDCASVPNLLDEIDCKLTQLAKKQYNNTIFALNYPLQGVVWLDLLNYKRILMYKFCNPEYACDYSIQSIASKVKLLIFK